MFIKRAQRSAPPAGPAEPGGAASRSGKGSQASFRLFIAGSLFGRLGGLMFRRAMPDDSALLIPECNWIHSMFMFYGIDAVFLDGSFRVVAVKHLRPFRLSLPVMRARHVLEINGGLSTRLGIGPGDFFTVHG